MAKGYLYKVGQILEFKQGRIEIIEQIRLKHSKNSDYLDKGYRYKCLECGYIGEKKEGEFKRERGCRACVGQTINVGKNDLWITHPEVAKQLLNEEDGYTVTYSSTKYLKFKCSECGNIVEKQVQDVARRDKLFCSNCSDGVPMGERILGNILTQLNIEYKHDSKMYWSNNKRYDFYIPSLNMIIETHGEQHYTKAFGDTTVEEQQENDEYKKDLALENGINKYIVIDTSVSDFNYIYNSIESSLHNLFDFNKLDIEKLKESSSTSLFLKVCKEWKDGNSLEEIAKINRLSVDGVRKYVKRETDLGYCYYNGKEEILKAHQLKKLNKE